MSRIVFWAGLLLIGVCFFPSFTHEKLNSGHRDSLTIGIPGATWYARIVTVTDLGTSPSGVQMSRELQQVNTQWLSWSSLALVLGIVLVVGSSYLKVARPVQQSFLTDHVKTS